MKKGHVRMSFRALKEVLGLPDSVEIQDIYSDPTRQLVGVVVSGPQHESGLMFDIAEGAEIPVTILTAFDPDNISPTHYRIYEQVRDKLIGAESEPVDEGEEDSRC